MSNHCRDCKWWVEGIEIHSEDWDSIERAKCMRQYYDDTLFYADTADGYPAIVFAEADFGCVQWEPKEAAA